MKKDVDFLKNNIIAHRGYHTDTIPENSIDAFKKAIKNNYTIELDVHLLKDKKIVVFHDDNLRRMTGVNKKIKTFTYENLKDIKLKNTKYTIPTIEEVLKLVDGKVPLIIELKYDNKVGLLEKELVKVLDNYKGIYAIKSFNPLTVLWFRIHRPKVIRGQLSGNFTKEKFDPLIKKLLKSMILNIITKPDFISYDIKALPTKKMIKLRKRKLVLSWTIRNKKDYLKALLYADNYICENMDKYINN